MTKHEELAVEQIPSEKKIPKPLTEEHLQELRRQPRVTKAQFTEELCACLEDYFEGTVREEGDGIYVALPNGERFYVHVTEKKKK